MVSIGRSSSSKVWAMGSSGGGFQAVKVLAALAFQSQDAFWACTTVELSQHDAMLYSSKSLTSTLLSSCWSSCQHVGNTEITLSGREGGRERALWRQGQRLPRWVCPASAVNLYSLGSCALFLKTTTSNCLRTLLNESCPVLALGSWTELKVLKRETAGVQEQSWDSDKACGVWWGKRECTPFLLLWE